MKFGGFVPQGWRMDLVGVPVADQWTAMQDVAQRLERSGYESLWLYDHFHTVPEPTQESTFECWSLMAALAAVTDTIRLGQMCTCNSYRPPAYLAKVTSSIDVISGGRLDLGIGAGWYEHEYLGYGYEFPKASVRIGQLREAVDVILAMWTEDEVSYQGEYYQLAGAINRPKPVQDPHPPLWIAGGGEKLTLRLVAEKADYANFAVDLDTFVRKAKILEQHCADVGRDPSEIGTSLHTEVVVAESDAALGPALERAARQRGVSATELRDRSSTTIGTPEQVVATLGAVAAEGCDYVIAYFPDAIWGESVELFATEVIPHLT
jgi:F420-dependent oxidoreductase-like protein